MEPIEVIRNIVAQHGKLPVDVSTLADDADLYAAGLTSLATVSIMLAIEEHFDIEFPETKLGRKTFESFESMAETVEEIVD